MALLVWCAQCAAALQAVPGPLPDTCRRCGREAHWTTTPPYALTVADRQFLKTIHVAA